MFLPGVAVFPKAFKVLMSRPKLLFMGMIPPAITSVLYGLVAYFYIPNVIDFLVTWATSKLTGFWQDAASVLITAVTIVAFLAVGLVIFSTITLTIGGPIYQKISETVDKKENRFVAFYDEPTGKGIWRGIYQSLIIMVLSLAVAAIAFFSGFIPVLGTIVSFILSIVVTGVLVSLELLDSPFTRRGKTSLKYRWEVLKDDWKNSLPFAVIVQLLLAIPIVAVIAFPFVSAAATLFTHELIDKKQKSADTIHIK